MLVRRRMSGVALMAADLIIVIDGGRVTEQGSHHELLDRPHGVYRRLWAAQQEVDLLSSSPQGDHSDAEDARAAEERRQLTEHSG